MRPTTGRSCIRVVLADDHALAREGTAELLERAGGISVVGQAADGHQALQLVSALRPDVLRYLAQGLGNKQIATRLSLSARTVQMHLTRIFAKLGVTSRTEAVLYAVRQGWTSPDTLSL